MTMRSTLALGLATAMALAFLAGAEAREVYRPLVVKKRSFLDAGKVVAPGSIPTWSNTLQVSPPVWSYNDRFRANLPGPFGTWP